MAKRIAAVSTTLTLLCVATGSAQAAGFQLLEQNASGLGNAYAGSAAVAENASTIFYNPAGMTRLSKTSATVGLTPIVTSFKFSNSGSSAGALNNAGNGGDAGSVAFVPNGFFSFGITPDLYVGIGVSVPFGLKTDYDEPWIGGAQALLFEIKTVNINPSVAYRINDQFSLGAGLNVMRMNAEYRRLAAVSSASTASTKIDLDVDDDAYGWNAGILFSPTPTTSVGLSYRSTVTQKLDGTLSVTGTLAGASAALTSGSATATIKLPATYILSLKQQFGDAWTLLADVSRTQWSSIDRVDIVRTSGSLAGATVQTLDARFRDTWRIALGTAYQLNASWILKGGVAYDQTPVRGADTRLVSLPDNDRTWLSIGGQWALNKQSALDFGLAYLMIGDADINNNQTAVGRGTVKGSYEGRVVVLGAQFSIAF